MNGAFKATVRAIPKGTLYRGVVGIALGSTVAALAVATLLRPYLGMVAGYAFLPLLAASLAWVIAGVARLRVVGFLPSEVDHCIPPELQPWIRFWLLARFGLLCSMLLLIAAIIVTASVQGPLHYGVEALVYVVIIRIFMDLSFGAAFNLGVIVQRLRTS